MFSFEGDFKNKRNINLGGKSAKVADKAELLRKAQRERQNRERERLRLQSAQTVQAFWRGRSCVKRLRAAARVEWDSDLAAALHQLAATDQKAVAQTALRLAQRFLFFYSPTHDHQRLEVSLCHFLLQQTTAGILVFLTPWVNELAKEWSFVIARLLPICFASLDVNDGMSMTNPEEISNVFKFLVGSLDPQIYASMHRGADNPYWSALHQNLIISNQDALYKSIRNFLLAHPSEHKRLLSVSAAIHLTTLPLDTALTGDVSIERNLITQILTVESLPNRISIDALTSFSRHIHFTSLISFMENDVRLFELLDAQRGANTPDPYAALLGNLLAFSQPNISKFDADTMGAYAHVLQLLIQRLPPSYLNTVSRQTDAKVPPLGNDSDDEQDDQTIMKSGPSYAIDPWLRKWLLTLIKPSSLLQPFVRSLPSSDWALNASALVQTRRIASFLLALMTCWNNQKSDIGTALLFKTEAGLLRGMWVVARRSQLWEGLAFAGKAEYDFEDLKRRADWPVLLLCCELLVRLLTTLGDDELFGNYPPFAVADLVALSGTIKNATFDLYWNERANVSSTIPDTSITLSHITEVFTRLLQQIHARDSRRSFCPSDHWLAPGSAAEQTHFLEQVVQQTSITAGDNNDEENNGGTERKMLLARNSAKAKPSHAILRNIPFVIPFETRVNIFRARVHEDRQRYGLDENWHAPVARVTIRRQYVFEDGFAQLNALGASLKSRIAITFISEQGLVEAGIDGGGVFKEFLTTISKQAFDMNYGLFQATESQLLYPAPHSYASQDMQLHHLEFLGRIVGKALYEGVLVDVAFANFFLTKWLGQRSYLDDLPSLDQGLYQGLMVLKHYTGDVEGDLGLTFSVDDAEFGAAKSIDLIPNGSNIAVTKENRIQYIYLMANYKLNTQIQRQCQAFFSGLVDLIAPEWLQMFNQQELQILLAGDVSAPISLDDLRANTVYGGGFTATHPTIEMFWEIVDKEFTDAQLSDLVKFVTSCARPPLLGFSELRPGFCIRMAGEEVDRLPTASTCVNLLKMPAYTDRKAMKSKLLYAISSGAGFELS
ncbi:hypothetical protein HDU87_007521 [Geranomyces variabilis]|uniref:HECT-type E3 ubiquitin transferase n=1 Tax=Geranomyces variabilis TaxID=109894 RepID=A0AAD5TPI6_9FUNG|nr:hypothetical protein HDU87_007521 [Geranomyces variabilis]